MKKHLLLAALALPLCALAAPPSLEEALSRYDAMMGPENMDAVMTMIAHREDGTMRTYRMRLLKAGSEKTRVWFQEPAAVRGQEILRQGENSWVYMPNLKRAIRLANRDSFQGGDFNNADVLRTNYQKDYSGQVNEDPAMPEAWLLELKAKTSDAAYDHVKLWLARKDSLPIKGEYYSASGKMLRSADFKDVRNFKGLRRPAHIVMRNMIATQRFSELTMESVDIKVTPPSGRFVLDDLGR